MQPDMQQPDFGLLPTAMDMQPLAATGLRGGGQPNLDAPMGDLSINGNVEPVQAREGSGLSLGIFRGKSKTTKDGSAPKKRGPKRDAKPAVSRRQELNRQAQRTHRERKEYYTKSLELEVSRMRETYTQIVREKQQWEQHAEVLEQQIRESATGALLRENEQLRQILRANGIAEPSSQGLLSTDPAEAGMASGSLSSQARQPSLQQAPVLTQPNSQSSFSSSGDSRHGSLSAPSTGTLGSVSDVHPAYRQDSITTVGSTMTTPQAIREMSIDPDKLPLSPTSLVSAHTPASMGMQDFSGSTAMTSPLYPGSSMGSPMMTSLNGQSHSALHSALHSQMSTPGPCQHGHGAHMHSHSHNHQHHQHQHQHSHEQNGIDSVIASSPGTNIAQANGSADPSTNVVPCDMHHDQLGVEFVLALEENCRDHQQFLNLRANPPKAKDVSYELSGHAMMLTNPPPSHIATNPDKPYHEPPKIPLNNLMQLLETAQRLPLTGGEITPVLALRLIREDKRYQYLSRRQFEYLTERLRHTSRCYGFGAVLEEYEVRDAIDVAFEQYGPSNPLPIQ